MLATEKSLWKKFFTFVLVICILTSGFTGIAGASIVDPNASNERAYVSIDHYYDGTIDYDIPSDFLWKTISIGTYPLPDWTYTKAGTYNVTDIKIIDQSADVLINRWLYNSSSGGYDFYNASTEAYALGQEYSISPDSYNSGIWIEDDDYVEINGDNWLDIGVLTQDVTINFYYGDPDPVNYKPHNYEKTGSVPSYDTVNIGDSYNFKNHHNYHMIINYTQHTNPGPYSYVHTVHNYEGIIDSPSGSTDYCEEINEDRVLADQEIDLSNRIQKNFNDYEYIIDSITIQYETINYTIDYWNEDYSNNFNYEESLVVGDVVDLTEHSSKVYSNGPLTVSEYFAPQTLTEDDNLVTKIIRKYIYGSNYLTGYFATNAVYPLTQKITYFNNDNSNLPSNDPIELNIDSPTYTFEEGLHYVLKINYKRGFPITHHYNDGEGNNYEFSEGKTATYDVNTPLYEWNKPVYGDETYSLVRIEVIESASSLNIKHYSNDSGYVDEALNTDWSLFYQEQIPVIEGYKIPVSMFLLNENSYSGHNSNNSSSPWLEELRYSLYDVMEMDSGKNFLNILYSSLIIPRAIATIVSPDGSYLHRTWTPNDLDPANYQFTEGKAYEVHYYYEQSGASERYTLTYDGNGHTGGSVPTDSNTYPSGSYATVQYPWDLEKDSYFFSHWNEKADGTGNSYYPGFYPLNQVLMTQDTTVYATWARDLPVNHNYYPENYPEDPVIVYSETKSALNNVEYDLESWARYANDGYYYSLDNVTIHFSDLDGSNPFDVILDSSTYYLYTFDADKKYEIDLNYNNPSNVYYYVIYLDNGTDSGYPPEDSNYYYYGGEVTVLDNIGSYDWQTGTYIPLEKDGYDFIGWNMYEDLSGMTYAPESKFFIDLSIPAVYMYGNYYIYLYPVWEPSDSTKYNVTFNAMGGTFDDAAVITTTPTSSGLTYDYSQTDSSDNELLIVSNVTSNVLISEPSPATTKADYVIEGWYTTEDYQSTSKWDFGTNKITGDVTLYAKWISGGNLPLKHIYNTNGAETNHSETKLVGWDVVTDMSGWPVLDPDVYFTDSTLDGDYQIDKIVIREPGKWWIVRHFEDDFWGTQIVGSKTLTVYDSTITPAEYVESAYDSGKPYKFNDSYSHDEGTMFVISSRYTNINDELEFANEGANYINLFYKIIPSVINTFISGNYKYSVITDDPTDPNDSDNNLSNPHFTFESGKEYEVEIYYSLKDSAKYTVTYDANGGIGNGGNANGESVPIDILSPYSAGSTVMVLENYYELEKDGYSFSGWNTAADGLGTSYAADGTGTFTMPANDVVLYAEWKINEYTVIYNATDGAFVGDETVGSYFRYFDNNGQDLVVGTVTHGSTVPFPSADPTAENKIFDGWYVGDSAGVISDVEWTETTPVVERTFVYAKWEPVKYTVKFISNGGVFDESTIVTSYDTSQNFNVQHTNINETLLTLEVPHGTLLDIPRPYPTKADPYIPGGTLGPGNWHTDLELTQLWSNTDSPIIEDTTLYLKWNETTKADMWILTFNAMGGQYNESVDGTTISVSNSLNPSLNYSFIDDIDDTGFRLFIAEPVLDNSTITAPDEEPTREGYEFKGWWYYHYQFGQQPEVRYWNFTGSADPTNVTDSHILYAEWEDEVYDEITVTKVWTDDSDSAGFRPDNVTVRLMNGLTQFGSDLVIENATWTNSWTDVPKYANGQLITYTVEEVDVPTEYTSVSSGTASSGFTVTNTFDDLNYSQVTVTKVWTDDSDSAGFRPDNVTVRLMNGLTQFGSDLVIENATWTNSWTDVPKYANGQLITYTVEEVDVPTEYTSVSSGTASSGFTVTNTFDDLNYSQVTVTKVWTDDSDSAGFRPDNVTVRLMNGLTQFGSDLVIENATWTNSWTDVPKYANGQLITYTVEEVDVPTEYTSVSSGTASSGFTVTNTFDDLNYSQVTVTKVWTDDSDSAGFRPDNVTVRLMNGLTQFGSDLVIENATWTNSWTDVPKYANGQLITYTVEEVDVPTEYTSVSSGTASSGFTVTNTFDDLNYSQVTVTKVWTDDSDSAGFRPDNVTVRLMNGLTQFGSDLVIENATWTNSWTDVPKYANGQLITYTVEEVDVPTEYTSVSSGTASSGFTVTNTFDDLNYSQVTVTKVWTDDSDSAGFRPDNVTVRLMNGLTQFGSDLVIENATWTNSWTDVPKYANGQLITYTVEEVDVPTEYTSVSSGTASSGFTVTNTFDDLNYSQVTVTKVWTDDSDSAGFRPDNVTVRLMNGLTQFGSDLVIENATWTNSWTDVPKYANGQLITYTVEEVDVPTEYTSVSSGTASSGFTVTNTFDDLNYSQVTVTKVWTDDSDSAGFRPDNVTVRLMNGLTQFGSDLVIENATWTNSWTDVPKYANGQLITYTVEEVDVPTEYTSVSSGTASSGFTVTNTFDDLNYSQVTVTKVWTDDSDSAGFRPDNVTVRLMNGLTQFGSDLVIENATWTNSWTDVPKYANGQLITYTVEEVDVPTEYTSVSSGTASSGFTVTNTFDDLNYSQVTVTKVWTDDSDSAGFRPDNVTVRLMNGLTQFGSDLVIENATWTNSWTDVPKYANGQLITYTVEEVDVPTEYTSVSSGTASSGFTVTNTFDDLNYSQVTVTKVWTDDSDSAGFRPDNVTVRLMNGLTQFGSDLVIENATWTNSWTDVPKYANGQLITYTVEEVDVPTEYTSVSSGTASSGFTVTNTFDDLNYSQVTVTKVWTDDSDSAGFRPDNVTVRLMNGLTQFGSDLVIENATWTNSWTDVPKYANGQLITYTVEEVDVPTEYTSVSSGTASSGFTVTNTFDDLNYSQVTVTKVWTDDSDSAGFRPDNVTVRLMNGLTQFGSDLVIENATWTNSWTDVPKYANGQLITYTVEEVDVPTEYTSVSSGTASSGFTVTNTFDDLNYSQVTVTKVWTDDSDSAGFRPDNVTVRLMNGLTQFGSDLVIENATWTNSWTDVPKYANGQLITYTVEEVDVPTEYTSVSSGTASSGFTVTNTFDDLNYSQVTVTKVWTDDSDSAGFRPDNVTVRLMNGLTQFGSDLVIENATWTNSWTDVPKYANGQLITYTVEEVDVPTEYTSVSSGTASSGFTVTNTFDDLNYSQVTVTKVWTDDSDSAGFRPDNVTVRLMNGLTQFGSDLVIENATWTNSWTDVPKYANGQLITYTVEEVDVPTEYTSVSSGTASSGFTVTNTFDDLNYSQVTVTKVWTDDSDSAGFRPDNVTVRLMNGLTQFGSDLVIENATWTNSWTDVPKYANGQLITYTVEEVDVPTEYTSVSSGTASSGFTVTNTFDDLNYSQVTVTKVWTDDSDSAGFRPDNVTVRLMNGLTQFGSDLVIENATWTNSWTDVPKYANGQLITYTVEEVDVPTEYTSVSSGTASSGFTVTNTFDDLNYSQVTVTKVWTDDSDSAGFRPDNVTVRLMNGLTQFGSDLVIENATWTNSWTDVPKYANGQLITYTVEEVDVPTEYTSVSSGTASSGFTVTNTFDDLNYSQVTVTKVWTDDSDSAGFRPDNVTVRLMNGLTQFGSDLVIENATWTNSWTDVPKYANGQLITYTVEEVDVPTEYTSVSSGTASSGFTVTNTFDDLNYSQVTVTKVWTDDSDSAGFRPDNVTVRLMNGLTQFGSDLVIENATWTNSWTDVPKYANGQLITYTVEEVDVPTEYTSVSSGTASSGFTVTNTFDDLNYSQVTVTKVWTDDSDSAGFRPDNVTVRLMNGLTQFGSDLVIENATWTNSWTDVPKYANGQLITYTVEEVDVPTEYTSVSSGTASSGFTVTNTFDDLNYSQVTVTKVWTDDSDSAGFRPDNVTVRLMNGLTQFGSDLVIENATWTNSWTDVPKYANGQLITYTVEEVDVPTEYTSVSSGTASSGFTVTNTFDDLNYSQVTVTKVWTDDSDSAGFRPDNVTVRLMNGLTQFGSDLVIENATWTNSWTDVPKYANGQLITYTVEEVDVPTEYTSVSSGTASSGFTVTNTFDDLNYSQVTVTKVWTDDSDSAGFRPDNVTVRLMNGLTQFGSDLVIENATWTNSWTDVPKYANGQLITYTVEEVDVPTEYTSVSSGTASSGFTVTNTFDDLNYSQVTVTKVWTDDSDSAGFRPDNVTVRLMNGLTQFGSDLVIENATWTNSWTDVPKYANGQLITYTVEEVDVPTEYTSVSSGTASSGFTVTNTFDDLNYSQVTVTKVWTDDSDSAGFRPDNVTVRLMNGLTQFGSDLVIENATWTNSWTDVPKYANGQLITYTVEEVDVPTEYTSVSSGTASSGFTVTNTFDDLNYSQVTVTKVWTDDSDSAGFRPDNVTVRLMNGLTQFGSDLVIENATWTNSWTDVPKYANGQLITYTVEEVDVPTEYTSVSSGTASSGFTVTNTFDDLNYSQVTVTKVWTDDSDSAGFRPDNVTVRLMNGLTQFGSDLVIENATWTNSWTDVPKYANGQLITYTVEEVDVPTEYTSVSSGTASSGFTVTNTFDDLNYSQVTVTKVWTDDSDSAGFRPDNVTVRLMNGLTQFGSDLVIENATWTNSWTDVPKYANGQLITYTVEEVDVPTEYTSVSSGTASSGFTVTNTFDDLNYSQVTVTKVWTDDSDSAGFRPDNVTVRLMNGLTQFGSDLVIENATWTNSWTDVPKYANGQLITYTVEEVDVPTEYTSVSSGTASSGFTVTNTFDDLNYSQVTVTKVWTDDSDSAGFRPDNVTVRLMNGLTQFGSDLVIENATWTNSWTDVPKYANGQLITYTVEEVDVPTEYTSVSSGTASSGFTVTNTFDDLNYSQVTVTKVWTDDSDSAGFRPDNVTVRLMNGLTQFGSDLVIENATWTNSWTDVPKYANGQLITYTVEEVDVPTEYTSVSSGTASSGFTVTNTFDDLNYSQVTVTKVWTDDSDSAGFRPDNVTVRLMNGLTQFGSDLVIENATWTNSWTDVPKYANGQLITYTVEEVDVPTEYTSVSSGTASSGFTVTNTFDDLNYSQVTVTKVWTDDSDSAGFRPDNVTVRLMNGLTQFGSDLVIENATWTNSWTDVPKYANGQLITYTVEEVDVPTEYTSVSSGTASSGFTVTNTFDDLNYSQVTVTKVWTDDSDSAGFRPDNVTVRLMNGLTQFGSDLVIENATWTNSWTDVPKYANGQLITYTVEEVDVPTEYTSVSSGTASSGFTVTNTFDDLNYSQVTVTKVWTDDSDSAGFRPDNVTVRLMNGLTQFGSDLVIENATWTNSWTDVPKYANGQLITYTVEEVDVPTEYTSVSSGTASSGFTVTNTFDDLNYSQVTVTKVWTDDSDSAGFRPDNVTVRLMNGLTQFGSDLVIENATWTNSWTDVPKYANGQLITYTVEEVDVPTEYTSVSSGTASSGFTVTNTFDDLNYSQVTVTKVWTDDSDSAGFRPDNVTVRLMNGLTQFGSDLVIENATWTNSWTDVPKYANGQLITYTVEEVDVPTEYTSVSSGTASSGFTVTNTFDDLNYSQVTVTKVWTDDSDSAGFRPDNVTVRLMNGLTQFGSDLVIENATWTNSWTDVPKYANGQLITYTVEEVDVPTEYTSVSSGTASSGFTVTNTFDDLNYSQVTVTKVWTDDSDSAGFRPDNVTVRLMNGLTQFGSDLVIENATWTNSWTDVPKYANGQLITYTVEEVDVPTEYTSVSSGTASSGFTVTNTFDDLNYSQVTVTKVWTDDSDSAGFRPDNVTVRLMNGLTQFGSDLVIENATWTNSWTDVPKYANGQLITYTVEEVDVPTEYTSVSSGTASSGFTVTNTFDDLNYSQVTVTKVWTDDSDSAGFRPDNVTVRLMNGLTQFGSDLVIENATWTNSWTDVPKYANGQLITYTVEEVDVPTEYTSVSSGTASSGFTVTNTFDDLNYSQVTVTKVWTDDSDSAGFRPDNVTVRLMNGLTQFGSDLVIENATWTNSWTDVPKYANGQLITYTVEEVDVPTEYTSVSSGTASSGFTVTNTFDDLNYSQVTVTKVWTDDSDSAGFRPDNVTVRLMNGLTQFGSDLVIENATWTNSWTDVPKYANGQLITYTVEEVDVPTEYTSVSSGTASSGFTVTNTFDDLNYSQVTVTKVWTDDSDSAGFRPDNVTVRLMNGLTQFGSDLVIENATWTNSWTDVPKYANGQLITYTVEEVDVPTEYTSVSSGTASSGFTVTNTFDDLNYSQVTVTKVWTDDSDSAGFRPDNVTVRLMNGLTQFGSDLVIENATWTNSWTDVPKYANGQLITYTVEEVDVPTEYTSVSSGTASSGFTVTNTFDDLNYSQVTVTKVWTDDSDSAGFRPDNVTVRLMNGLTQFGSDLVIENATWTNSWTDVPKYANGQLITYTVEEVDVPTEYTSVSSGTASSGFTVTNTFDDLNYSQVTVTKVWTDDSDSAGFRPDNVTVRLMNGLTQFGSDLVIENATWTNSWTDVPKYANGQLITYTVEEVDVPTEYTSVSSGTASSGFTVTNTFDDLNYSQVTVTKVWTDDSDSAGFRPDNVTVRLMNGLTQFGSDLVIENATWTNSWTDVPKYANGQLITYTVEEVDVPTEYTSVSSGTASSGFTVTNTFDDLNYSQVTVTKVWTDDSDSAGFRPDNVTVRLMNGLTQFGSDLVIENATWTNSWTDVPKYANGQLITYTVEEVDVPTEYTSVSSGTASSGFTVTNTFDDLNYSQVTVTKVWTDDSDSAGFRPDNVTVRLMNGLTQFGSDLVIENATWTNSWTDVPKYANGQLITYTVEEVDVPTEYTSVSSGTASSGFTVTNTFDDLNYSQVTVTKVWTDDSDSAGFRPDNVTVRLMNGLTQFGSDLVIENATWTNSWTDVPKYANGQLITYTVEEVDVPTEYTSVSSGTASSGFTVTNTFDDLNYSQVTVTKVWTDDSDSAGFRPDNVTVRLMNGLTQFGSDLVIENATWTNSWTDVPKYANGQLITYTVEEVDVPTEYTSVSSGTASSGFTVTNTFDDLNYSQVTVTKVWTDDSDSAGFRPDNVTVRLMNGLTQFGSDLVIENATWTNSWTDVPKYANGQLITYTVEEVDVPTEYTSVSSGTASSGFTVTNTFDDLNYSQVTVTKVWTDDSDSAGFRPDNVTVRLMNGLTQFGSDLVIENATWTNSWTDVPKYANGQLITYTVEEVDVPTEYTSVSSGTASSGFTVTNTFDDLNYSQVTVTKVWTDDSDSAGFRPDNVTVRLMNGLTQFGSDLVIENATWTNSWTDVPKYANGQLITYTVEEVDVPTEYTSVSSGTASSGFTVTNTFDDLNYSQVTVTKVWTDDSDSAGFRPDNVTVRLMNGLTQFGSDLVIENATWTNSWTDVPKYANGQLITYTVEEVDVPTEYTSVSSGTASSGFTVTNTFDDLNYSQVTVTKVWTDDSDSAGFRPDNVTVRLMNGLTQFGSDLVIENATWTNSWTDVPKYANGQLITYTVEEVDVPTEYTSVSSGTASSGFTVTNTYDDGTLPELFDLTVTKVWNDAADTSNRPTSIEVVLIADGIEQDTQTLSDADWTYTWDDLDRHDSLNNVILYEIEEKTDLSAYYTVSVTRSGDTFTVTNSLKSVPTINITVEKIWDDDDNRDGKRPEDITVQLIDKNDTDKVVAEKVLNESNSWFGEWLNMPAEFGIHIPDYDVWEKEVPQGYIDSDGGSSYNATDINVIIKNSYTPENTDIKVEKIWDDDNDKNGKRPSEITVKLMNGNTVVDTVQLKASDSPAWTYEWTGTNLFKYDNGIEIDYTIVETVPTNYTQTSNVKSGDTITITNKYTPGTTPPGPGPGPTPSDSGSSSTPGESHEGFEEEEDVVEQKSAVVFPIFMAIFVILGGIVVLRYYKRRLELKGMKPPM
ncbi:hypothetical protein MmiHf6_12880 [Methanimicrococcus hongohii]|uniref:CNA-B domain-containing protein n=1 Tax=Methanimicrococcus hongohii TaxID=3028295 RepID=A0AA96V075_9EURY|nr:Cna B-type domain-containing protein [Methanimicrococcus sp. Hf6]WNY23964.1 hypothetical protein MmiHf6_12880 [Methanimicrococcus sp. Hf6]